MHLRATPSTLAGSPFLAGRLPYSVRFISGIIRADSGLSGPGRKRSLNIQFRRPAPLFSPFGAAFSRAGRLRWGADLSGRSAARLPMTAGLNEAVTTAGRWGRGHGDGRASSDQGHRQVDRS